MKKLLAVLVVFALVAGAVFAEVGLSGSVKSGVVLFGSNGEKYPTTDGVKGPDVNAWWTQKFAPDFSVSAQSEDSVIGGKYNFNNQHAHVWWQPLSVLKISIGDGSYSEWDTGGRGGIVGWGFTAGAQDFVSYNGYSVRGGYKGIDGIVLGLQDLYNDPSTTAQDIEDFYMGVFRGYNGFDVGTGFYGGFGQGLKLELFPIDGLHIYLGIPFPGKADAVYSHLSAQAVYNVDGLGSFSFAFVGKRGYKETKYTPTTQDSNGNDIGSSDGYNEATSKLFFDVSLSAIENVGLELGIAYQLPKAVKNAYEYNYPLEIGLGASYSAGDFGVKARVATKLGESIKMHGDDKKTEGLFQLGFSIVPSYNLGVFQAFLKAGIMITGVPKYDGKVQDNPLTGKKFENAFGWHVNPYITKSIGPGTFFAGFKVGSDGIKSKSDPADPYSSAAVEWSVPIGIQFNF